jgi:hypothetical protein
MLSQFAARKTSLQLAGVALFLLSSAARAQQVQDCQQALQVSGGGILLADATTTTTTQKVDEWEGDILKLRINRPGVLVLSGEGAGVQGSLYAADPASGGARLEDGGAIGTAHRPLTMVVQPGEHCVQVTPDAGAAGTLRLRTTFFDVCRLGPQDDHGDSFLCATAIGLGESRTGEIAPADQDVFSFTLAAGTAVTIDVTGTPDLLAGLYREDGTLLAADGRGTWPLDAGSYFVRIEGGDGPGGAYTIGVSASPQ